MKQVPQRWGTLLFTGLGAPLRKRRDPRGEGGQPGLISSPTRVSAGALATSRCWRAVPPAWGRRQDSSSGISKGTAIPWRRASAVQLGGEAGIWIDGDHPICPLPVQAASRASPRRQGAPGAVVDQQRLARQSRTGSRPARWHRWPCAGEGTGPSKAATISPTDPFHFHLLPSFTLPIGFPYNSAACRPILQYQGVTMSETQIYHNPRCSRAVKPWRCWNSTGFALRWCSIWSRRRARMRSAPCWASWASPIPAS